MALKIIDALRSGFPHDGSFGCAHLIFDRDIDLDPLRVSLKRLLDQDQEYLGQSSSRANWSRMRYFFDAGMVARGGGQTVYVLGPEVSTFVLDESMLEVATEDNSIREVAVWRDISLDFRSQASPTRPRWTPNVPPQVPAAVERPAPRRQQPDPPRDIPKVEQPTATATTARDIPPDIPKAEQPAATAAPTSALPPDIPKAEQPATTAAAAASDPGATAQPTPEKPVKSRLPAAALVAIAVAVVIGALYAIYWATQNRDTLCDHFRSFCSAEETAYHDAQSCAAAKTCGASECVAHYRDAYPNGRFNKQIDDIAVEKGRPCYAPPGPIPGPRPGPGPDADRAAYEQATQCAQALSCGAEYCLMDYRHDFPAGRYRAEIDAISRAKGGVCPPPSPQPTPFPTPSFPTQTPSPQPSPFPIQRPSPQPSPSLSDTLPPFVPIRPDDYTGIRDCNSPRLEPVAQMICRDSDMGRANGELQRVYDSRTRSPAEKRDEAAWIQDRDRDCNIPQKGSPWSIDDLRRVKNCFLERTRARSSELRAQ